MSEIHSGGSMLLPLLQESSEMVHFGSKCGKPKEGEKNYCIHRDNYWRSDYMYSKEREQELLHKDTHNHTEVTLWNRICANMLRETLNE